MKNERALQDAMIHPYARYTLCLLVTSLLFVIPLGGASTSLTPREALNATLGQVVVNVDAPGRTIPGDFEGLSVEYTAVKSYLGASAAAPNPVFRRLLANIGRGVLRIGGNSQDTSCWNTGPGVPHGGCATTFDASVPQSIFSTAAATQWGVIVGLNLAQRDASYAHTYVKEGIAPASAPPEISGLEIGNEPDLYGISLSQYLQIYNSYVDALKSDPATASLPIVGPSYATLQWEHQIGDFIAGVGAKRLAYVTVHYYPFNICSAGDATRATIDNLLSENTMGGIYSNFSSIAAMANAYGLGVRMDETNSVACKGKAGVSDTFASALWGLDYLFTLSKIGLLGLNFHIYDVDRAPAPGAYNPIVSTAMQSPNGTWAYATSVRPLYYAMLLFSNALHSSFVPTTLNGTSANIKVDAVSDGTNVRVFLLNKDMSASGTVLVQPSRQTGSATVTVLQAPSLDATSGTTLGGKSVDGSGTIATPDTQSIPYDNTAKGYSVLVPHASAVMVSFPIAGSSVAAPTQSPTSTIRPTATLLPPTATVVPSATATQTTIAKPQATATKQPVSHAPAPPPVRRGGSVKRLRPCRVSPPIAIQGLPRAIVRGQTVHLTVQTVRRSRVTVSLEVLDAVASGDQSGQSRRIRHMAVIYHTSVTGTTDAHGRFNGRVVVRYLVVKPMQARLTVTVTTSCIGSRVFLSRIVP